jgi:hypothetical protein
VKYVVTFLAGLMILIIGLIIGFLFGVLIATPDEEETE